MIPRAIFLASMLVLGALSTRVEAQEPPFEFWLSGGFGMSQRNASVLGDLGTGSGSGPLLEGGVRYRFATLRGRFGSADIQADSGTAAIGRISSGEVLLGVGVPLARAEVGFGTRQLEGSFATRGWTYVLAGGRVQLPLGGSGFVVGAQFHQFISARESEGDIPASGRAGETWITAEPWTFPVYFRLGYRVEQFTIESDPSFPDESATLGLGVGFRFRR